MSLTLNRLTRLKSLKYCLIPFYLLFLFSSVFSSAFSQEKTNILIFTGGKKIDNASFLKVFQSMEHITFRQVIDPGSKDLLASKTLSDYDVLVFYELVKKISKPHQQALIELLKNGKPILFLHHSLASYQNWNDYEAIIGGRFRQAKTRADSLKYTNTISTYRHHVDIPITIVNPKHPVTKGMTDFVIHDEVYGNFNVLKHVTPLLSTSHPENDSIMGWTHRYGNSQIVYLQLGDDPYTYNDHNFRKLVRQAIEWLARSTD